MAETDVLARWEEIADTLVWRRRFERSYEPGARGGRWFPGGELNVVESCLERHLPQHADRPAFHWEGEPGDRRTITYGALHAEVCALADALSGIGVEQGDRVALYMGLIPETIVSMLACARIGAVHAVMASALPADAVADRLADLNPKVLVTQDGAWRHGMILPLKARADDAIPAAAGIEHTVVVRRTGIDVDWYEGDRWYDDLVARPRPRPGTAAPSTPAPAVRADHPLLVAYIANRRGRPTGIVHATGGFLAYAAALHSAFSPRNSSVLWCAVEIAWLAGQSHGVYGPLTCGATSVAYEGMLDTPSHARAWDVIERYGVTSLATTFSVLRSLRGSDNAPRERQLSTLDHVVTAGEATDPDVLAWLVGTLPRDAAVADGWGQTELGGGVYFTGPTGRPDALPAAGLDVVDTAGAKAGVGTSGELVLRNPWPGTFVGIQNEDDDVVSRYWERADGAYTTGDRAILDAGGTFAFLGRIDPIVTISGQLVSLTEIREALLEHPFVADAEIVERIDRESGSSLAACVVLVGVLGRDEELTSALRAHVRERLGGLSQPRLIAYVDSFPDEIDADARREALRLLCTSARGRRIHITTDELRAAASSSPLPTV